MELSNDFKALLECINTPAFISDGSLIIHANASAMSLGLLPNGDLPDTFKNKAPQAEGESSKYIFEAYIQHVPYTVTASIIGELMLYTIEQSTEILQLQSLLRAAQQLRAPMSGLSSSFTLLAEKNKKKNDEEALYLIQLATKQLYSLHRIIHNMSDASLFLDNRSGKKETIDICSVLNEIVQKIIQQFHQTPIRITYDNIEDKLFCNVDCELITRAVYNMVSNALRADSKNIQIKLKRTAKKLQIIVQDDGCGMSDEQKSQILSSFNRNPLNSMQGYGLGLGMMIIHAAAVAHNGSLMIGDVKPHGCKISITLAIEKEPLIVKQEPLTIRIDPLGGIDPLMMELSDILPPKDFI